MGFFDFIKGKAKNLKRVITPRGFYSSYSMWNDDVTSFDEYQVVIRCIVNEIKKLKPMHVKGDGNNVNPVKGELQNVLDSPNPLMTTADFLSKVTTLLLTNMNAFILPIYYKWYDANGSEQRKYTALYPLNPTSVEFMEDASSELFIKFKFSNGYETTVKYCDIIHIREDYGLNEFLGGDENGHPNKEGLIKALNLNRSLLTGIDKAVKSSFAINGVVKYNTLIDSGDTQTAIKELEEKIANNESGLLPMDLKAEIIPFNRDPKIVDSETLKFIDEKLLRHRGVSLAILNGDYTRQQYEAFYQKALEPIIITITQALNKSLFTDRQKAYGNKIMLLTKDLVFMSIDQKLEMIRLLGDSGTLYENEKRVALGLAPLAELEGKRMQSLNYVNVEIANNYQVGGSEND